VLLLDFNLESQSEFRGFARLAGRPRIQGFEVTTDTTIRSGQQLIKEARARLEELDPAQVNEILQHARSNGNADQAPVILDVRDTATYAKSPVKIPRSLHAPLEALQRDHLPADPDRTVVAYCT